MRTKCGFHGGGCPFARRAVRRVKGERRSLAGPVRGASFGSRASLEVWVTKPGTVGRALRIGFRRGKAPRTRSLCLPAGARRPKACR